MVRNLRSCFAYKTGDGMFSCVFLLFLLTTRLYYCIVHKGVQKGFVYPHAYVLPPRPPPSHFAPVLPVIPKLPGHSLFRPQPNPRATIHFRIPYQTRLGKSRTQYRASFFLPITYTPRTEKDRGGGITSSPAPLPHSALLPSPPSTPSASSDCGYNANRIEGAH